MKNAEIVSSVNENRLTTMLVLAGRPDQNKQVSCGIWFHHPKQYFNHNNNNNNGNNTDDDNAETIKLFNAQKPNYFLPTAVVQTISQYFSPAAVVLANWTHIIQSVNPINFFNDYSLERQSSSEEEEGKTKNGINYESSRLI
ncbi:unnamed protein product [Trichobilharzia regenti]|nr:unnamed protein product [Trichobilharzia regenti]